MLRAIVSNIIKWALKETPIDYSKSFPVAQCSWLDKTGNIMVFYPYGSVGQAPEKSYLLSFNVMAQEENRAGIEFNPELLPDSMEPGEYICGNFVLQSIVVFDSEGNININSTNNINATAAQDIVASAGRNVSIEAAENVDLDAQIFRIRANVEIEGNVVLQGNFDATGSLNNNDANVGSTHTHGGVETGPGNTGPPS